MIQEDFETDGATGTSRYEVLEEDNAIYLALKSLEYECHRCAGRAVVDLSIVPPHDIALSCLVCGITLCHIHETDFKRFIYRPTYGGKKLCATS